MKTNVKPSIEYPALIYKKNNFFVADCVMYNIAVIEKTKKEALSRLERIINNEIKDFNIQIRAVN